MSDKRKTSKIAKTKQVVTVPPVSSPASADITTPLESTPIVPQNPSFSRIKTDLQTALDDWDNLSAEPPKISAEEKRFEQMQQLLKDLHAKMKALNLI